ncbi:MAG TPA: lysylphosphatidylglycerol synthase transmembrane domain-containing protein [Planctomycetota bacterium]|jgi:hypothetical protein
MIERELPDPTATAATSEAGIGPVLRRWAPPLLKFLIAGGLLYYVLTTRVTAGAAESLNNVFVRSPAIFITAILAYSIQLFIGAQRVRVLLAPLGVKIPYWTMLRLTYLGGFFDTFMVTSVGGDAVKAIYLARETPKGHKLEAVSVLVLDRLMGLLGLLTLMVVMTLWRVDELYAHEQIRPYVKWLFIVPLLLLLGTAGLLSETVRTSPPIRIVLKYMPFGSHFERAYASLQGFRDRPVILLQTWVMSLVVHTCGVISGYVLVFGMGQTANFGPFLVAWFIANFIVSFAPAQGVGVGQFFFEPIFRNIAGLENGWVLATAVQATAILAKAPGAIAWLMSRARAPRLTPGGPGASVKAPYDV